MEQWLLTLLFTITGKLLSTIKKFELNQYIKTNKIASHPDNSDI